MASTITVMPSRAAPPADASASPRAFSAATGRGRVMVIALLVVAFGIAFLRLGLGNAARWSATADEPLHLAAGYAVGQHGDFRFDPTHPPLLRLWAALPLLGGETRALDRLAVDQTAPASGQYFVYQASDDFLFGRGDGDAVLRSARLMNLWLGVVLGLLIFCWAYEWFGLVPAALALLLCALEPNLSAHASLVTTDLGVTCWILGAVYFLWRTQRAFTPGNVAVLCAFTALAVVSKFSAVLLLPILAALLAASVRFGTAITARRAWLTGGLVAASCWFAIWAAYGFRYAPGPGAAPLTATAGTFAPSLPAAVLLQLDALHLLPNAYAQGFLNTVASADALPAFLNGRVSTEGWWYYLPFAFLVKTPSTLLALGAGGLLLSAWHLVRGTARDGLFLLVPLAGYLAGAMASGINLGVRHILPLYPFAILLAALAARSLLAPGRRAGRIALGALTLYAVIQSARVYPATLTHFNEFAGGPAHGGRYLSDSNLDWGQDLKTLKAWLDTWGVSELNLAYAGTVDPAHYGIAAIGLPGSPHYARLGPPKLPGYVALSATHQSGVYLSREWRMFYRGFEQLTPVATIGDTIRVYQVDRWPAPPLPDREDTAANAGDHLLLADAFAYQYGWPALAVPHYQAYVRQQPADSAALAKLGLALMQTGDLPGGRATFDRALSGHPQPGQLGADFALTLLRSGLADEAMAQARRAVTLAPQDALTHDALGLVLGRAGRHAEALAAFERALQLSPGSETIQGHVRAARQLAPAPPR